MLEKTFFNSDMRLLWISIIFIVLVSSSVSAYEGNFWVSNSSLKSGFSFVGDETMAIFKDGSSYHTIMGSNSAWYGYTWTGSSWSSNSSVISGLNNSYVHPSAIRDINGDGSLDVLITENFPTSLSSKAFSWNGSSWNENSSLKSGLRSDAYHFGLADFNGDDVMDVIYRSPFVGLYAYSWNGSSWVSNSSLKSGLSISDNFAHFALDDFTADSLMDMIVGYQSGAVYGYSWNGSSWVSDSGLVAGLTQTYTQSAYPYLYDLEDDGVFNSWVGKRTTGIYSYDWLYVADPCEYSGSGDWLIDLADDCVISSSEVVSGDIVVSGDVGSLTFSASVTAEGFSFEPDDFDGDSSVVFLSGASVGLLV